MTTANKITLFRLFMIPVFVTMAIYYGRSLERGEPREWQRIAAILSFLLAAVSDALDGYIARKYNQRSRLGVILDPIADKGLMLAAVITLSFSNWTYEFPIWFPVVVITRDIVIVSGTMLLHHLLGKVEIKPSILGKIATATQMPTIALVLLQVNFFQKEITVGGYPFHLDFLDIPVGIAGFFTVLSGIGYVIEGIRQLQAGGHAHAE